MSDREKTESNDECERCPIAEVASRRQFLRDATLAVGAIAASLGISRSAAAFPVTFVKAIAKAGTTRTYPIPATDGAQIDRDAGAILVRWQDYVYAFNINCPHQNTVLRWDEDDRRFNCPKHHSQYQPDGTFITGRATRNMDRFVIARDANSVVVNLDLMYKSDDDPAGWKGAAVKIS